MKYLIFLIVFLTGCNVSVKTNQIEKNSNERYSEKIETAAARHSIGVRDELTDWVQYIHSSATNQTMFRQMSYSENRIYLKSRGYVIDSLCSSDNCLFRVSW